MKGKFDAFVLWPLAQGVKIEYVVDRSTARDFTVSINDSWYAIYLPSMHTTAQNLYLSLVWNFLPPQILFCIFHSITIWKYYGYRKESPEFIGFC